MSNTHKLAMILIVIAATGPNIDEAQGSSTLSPCNAPEPVCAVRDQVFSISSFDPLASAVLVAKDKIVTNRHVLADETTARLTLKTGQTVEVTVIPSAYDGDLVLLQLPEKFVDAKPLTIHTQSLTPPFYVVGSHLGRQPGDIRVYPPGGLIASPSSDHPRSRIHSYAHGQPGNSGGALVDEKGKLVGIMTSGGDGLIEAIPALAIQELLSQTGPDHKDITLRVGRSYRACIEALDKLHRTHSLLSQDDAKSLSDTCSSTKNRQYMDLAAQALGQSRQLELSEQLLDQALALDPNGPNTLLSMAITLHLGRQYDREIPILRQLIKLRPRDVQVLRLSIQAGKFGGALDLSEKAYQLLVKHHPKLAPLARDFLDGRSPGSTTRPNNRQ